jgi:hypothetical protein
LHRQLAVGDFAAFRGAHHRADGVLLSADDGCQFHDLSRLYGDGAPHLCHGPRLGGQRRTFHRNRIYRNRHGLPPNSAVQIRIHAGHSASPSAIGANDSFAEQFFAEMRNLLTGNGQPRNAALGGVRFPKITVRGYTKSVGIYLGVRWAGWKQANQFSVNFQ